MLENNISIRNFFIVSVIVFPVIGLMATPYYKLSLLVAPLFLVMTISLSKRDKIDILFYIIIFLIPFGEYRKIGSINIPWLLAIIVLAAVAVDIVLHKRNISELKSRIWYYLLPMLFVNLVSTGLSPYMETALDAMKNWVAAYLFIALVLLLITEQGVFKYLPAWIITSVTLGSTLAVMGVYAGIGTEFFTKDGRGTGGAPDPNNMSLMIIFSTPMVLHYFLYAKSRKMKSFMAIVLFINIMGIFSTNSRGGMLVAAFVAFVMIIVHIKNLKARYIGLAIPLISILLIAFPSIIPNKALERLVTIASKETDRSIQRRSSYLDVGLRAYMKRPIIGYGPFTFQHVFAESREARRFQRRDQTLLRQAHNTYLEILVGSGSLGIILFIGAIIQSIYDFNRSIKILDGINMAEYRDLIISFQVSFVGLLIYLFVFSDPYHKYLLIMLPLSALSLRYARRLAYHKKINVL